MDQLAKCGCTTTGTMHAAFKVYGKRNESSIVNNLGPSAEKLLILPNFALISGGCSTQKSNVLSIGRICYVRRGTGDVSVVWGEARESSILNN
jgi:hypothetical protein